MNWYWNVNWSGSGPYESESNWFQKVSGSTQPYWLAFSVVWHTLTFSVCQTTISLYYLKFGLFFPQFWFFIFKFWFPYHHFESFLKILTLFPNCWLYYLKMSTIYLKILTQQSWINDQIISKWELLIAKFWTLNFLRHIGQVKHQTLILWEFTITLWCQCFP